MTNELELKVAGQNSTRNGKSTQLTEGRRFSQVELLDVIALAESLHSFEKRKSDDEILKGLLQDEKEGYSMSTLLELARTTGVPSEYVNKAINLRYLSIEEKLKDIEDIGAIATGEVVEAAYRNKLFKALQNHLPSDKIIAEGSAFYILRNKQVKVKRGIFRRKEVLEMQSYKHPLASFDVNDYWHYLRLNIYDPIFTHACSDTLKKLGKQFSKELQEQVIIYNYPPGVE